MLVDLESAAEWTRQNVRSYGGDPNRIHLIGHSAGAHLSSLLVLRLVRRNKKKEKIRNEKKGGRKKRKEKERKERNKKNKDEEGKSKK